LVRRCIVIKFSWVLVVNSVVSSGSPSSFINVIILVRSTHLISVFSVWLRYWYTTIFDGDITLWRRMSNVLIAISHWVVNKKGLVLRTLLFLKILQSSLLIFLGAKQSCFTLRSHANVGIVTYKRSLSRIVVASVSHSIVSPEFLMDLRWLGLVDIVNRHILSPH
jgi:hypothetical protein